MTKSIPGGVIISSVSGSTNWRLQYCSQNETTRGNHEAIASSYLVLSSGISNNVLTSDTVSAIYFAFFLVVLTSSTCGFRRRISANSLSFVSSSPFLKRPPTLFPFMTTSDGYRAQTNFMIPPPTKTKRRFYPPYSSSIIPAALSLDSNALKSATNVSTSVAVLSACAAAGDAVNFDDRSLTRFVI